MPKSSKADPAGAPGKHRAKVGKRDGEGVRTQPRQTAGKGTVPLDAPEVTDIVVDQQTAVEAEDGASMNARSSVGEKLAGHPQVDG